MSSGANVQSIDAIKEFRVYLTKFQESAGIALGDSDAELGRTISWLEGEQQTYWAGQIRKRQEILARAEEALRHKKVFKDATGRLPSFVDEQKAVNLAKVKLAEAQEKLLNVKKWLGRFQKEILMYHGGVGRFSSQVSGAIPAAVAHLAVIIEQLEKYVGMGPATLSNALDQPVVTAGAYADSPVHGSMARAVEEIKTDPVETPPESAAEKVEESGPPPSTPAKS